MKPSKNSIQFLSSVTQNNISGRVWFAILSLYNHQLSFITNMLISTLEYIQLIVQVFLLNILTYNPKVIPKIFQPFIDISKLFSPGYLLSFTGTIQTPSITIFVALGIYTLFKYSLFGYIAFKSIRKREGERTLVRLWRWTVKLQGRVIYYFVASILISLYRAAVQEKINVGRNGNIAIKVISLTILCLEFLLSFLLLARFSHPIPNKDALSAKNQITEIITLSQKFTIQMIRIANITQLEKVAWISTLVGLIFSLFRAIYYLTTFPHYKLKTIQYQIGLILVVLCLNLGFLLQKLLASSYDQSLSMFFWVIIWVVLSILLILMARNYVNQVWINLITQKQTNNRELLIHKIVAIKEALRCKTVRESSTDNHSLSYLLKKTAVVLNDNKIEITSKEGLQKVIVDYLENCIAKFPSSNLVKLCLGHCYAKKLKKYGIAIKLLKELQSSSSYSTSLSASLIIHALQESIKTDYASNRSKFDLYTYMKDVSSVAELKELIVQQAEHQVNFYSECTSSTLKLNKIHSLAQTIDAHKQKIEKRMQKLLEAVPDYYLEPIMVYAHYNYVLNHSISQYTRYMKLYNQKSRKYEKMFNSEKLCKENLYHKDASLILLSGERKNITTVVYSSKSFVRDLGKDLIGRHIDHMVPEPFRFNVFSSVKALLEEGNKAHLDHVSDTFHFNLAKDSLIPCNTYLGIHPFFGQELHYILMLRKVSRAEETIIMKENGDIVTCTDRVGKRLGIFALKKKLPANQAINIKLISHDLARINYAFNIIDPYETNLNPTRARSIAIKELAQNSLAGGQGKGSLQLSNTGSKIASVGRKIKRSRLFTVKKDLPLEEAKELHSVYTTRGADLELTSLVRTGPPGNNRKKCYTYHCKVERKPFAASMFKIITLSEEHQGKYNVQNKALNESTVTTKRETTLANAEETEPEVESEHLASISDHVSSEVVSESRSESDEYIDTVIMLSETNRFSRATMKRPPVLATDRDALLFTTEPQITVQTERKQQSPRKTREPKKETVFHISNAAAEDSFYQSSNGSRRGRSGGMRASKNYEDALSLKYYPSFYKTLRILFYLVALYIFISQLALKLMVDNDLEALKVRKNVMFMTETRNYQLLTMYKYATSLWMFATGLQNEMALPPVARSASYLKLMKDSLAQLTASNKNLLISADSLDPENRDEIFQNNVQLYEGKSTSQSIGVNLTSFQATDKIIETSFRVVSSTKPLSASIPDLEIVLRNVLNGLLIADEATTNILMESLNELKSTITDSNIMIMYTDHICLAFIFVLFCVIVYKQYQREKVNLLAFSKLDRHEIIKVSQKVEHFKELVLKETEFENIDELKFSNFDYKDATKITFIDRNKVNRTTRQADLSRITRKYHIYPLNMLITILVISVIVFLKTYFAQKSITGLTSNLWQMYFADKVRLTVHLTATIAFTFLLENGTHVRNLDSHDQFQKEIASLPALIYETPDVFRNSDLTYDPVIQDILFGHACKYVTPGYPQTGYCQQISKNVSNAGLINFMTLFESDMRDYDAIYVASNKSREALNQIQITTFNVRVPAMTVIVNLMGAITQELGIIFGDILEGSEVSNLVNSLVLLILLIVLWSIMHYSAINRIREAENEFRNVLKTLPARVVLPNFMLKSYLVRTCKGRFDLVKAFTSE